MQNHDAGWREDIAGELAEREAIERLNEATHCESCGAPLDARHECDGFIIGDCCRRRLAAAFLREILAASQHAVSRYTETMVELPKGWWA